MVSQKGFWRDLILDASGSAFFFVSPNFAGELWVLNTASAALSIVKKGKTSSTPFKISLNSAVKIWADEGDVIGVSGGALNDIVSITSTFDNKPLPSGSDILGTVKIGDGTLIVSPITQPQGPTGPHLLPVDINPVTVLGAYIPAVTVSSAVVPPYTSLLGQITFGPVSVPAAQAETLQGTQATSTNFTGSRVFFSISAGPPSLTTPANFLTYVAIKGATSNVYYAVAFLSMTVQGWFDVQANGESITIVTRNQDTAAHVFSGSVTVYQP